MSRAVPMGRVAVNHLKNQYSKGPNIGFEGVNVLDIAFGTHIKRTSNTASVLDFNLAVIKNKSTWLE
jgi:hypothetical protein